MSQLVNSVYYVEMRFIASLLIFWKIVFENKKRKK